MAKRLQSVVLPGLQGKGHERKEAFLLIDFFGPFCIKTKRTRPPAAMSGTIMSLRNNDLWNQNLATNKDHYLASYEIALSYLRAMTSRQQLQQNSFGRNPAKQAGPVQRQGHSKFLPSG